MLDASPAWRLRFVVCGPGLQTDEVAEVSFTDIHRVTNRSSGEMMSLKRTGRPCHEQKKLILIYI